MQRYEFTVERPTNNPDGDPYEYLTTVYSREEAKNLCPLDGYNYAHVALVEKVIYQDEYGPYVRWEPLLSGALDLEELHGNEPLEKFMYPVERG